MNNRSVYISAIYVLLISFISFFFFEVVFDDSYDSFTASMSSFQFTNFALFDQHYLGMLVIRDLLKWIQELVPLVNVFSTAYIVLNILSLGYTIFTLDNLIVKRQGIVFRHFFFIVISLLFIENVLSITHTRFATLFAGVALINLLYSEHKLKNQLVHFLLFLLGFLARPESGIGAILIISVAHMIFNTDIVTLIRKLKLPFLSIVVLIGVFFFHRSFTDRFEILIEPDIEYALSTGRVIALEEMNCKEDTLRYEMATAGMFIDTEFVSLSFLKKITTNQFEFSSELFLQSCHNVRYYYEYYAVFPVFIFAYFILAVIFTKGRSFFLRLFLFFLFQFFLFVYLDYNVRIADRHVIGLNLIFLLLSTFYMFKKAGRAPLPSFFLFLLFVTVGISMGLSLKNGIGNQIQVFKDSECLENALNEIEKIQKNNNVIVTQNTIHLFDKNYSFTNQNNTANRYLMYDVSNYAIVPRNIAYLSALCNCEASNAKRFLTWTSKEKAVFLIDDERAQLMKKYLSIVHNIDAHFVPIESPSALIKPVCLENSVYQSYDLKYLIFD